MSGDYTRACTTERGGREARGQSRPGRGGERTCTLGCCKADLACLLACLLARRRAREAPGLNASASFAPPSGWRESNPLEFMM